jgi:hypothetical protein
MLFQQTSAPTGWTKSTTHNDKALRLTSGTVGTGGSVAFSTAMATPAGSVSGNPGSNLAVGAGNLAVSMSGNISDTTLSIAQMPAHNHNIAHAGGNSGAAFTGGNNAGAAGNVANATSQTGGGAAHNHGHNLSGSMSGDPALTGNITSGNLAIASTINVQYVDFIIANHD